MKERIMNIGSGTIPIAHQTFLIKQATNLAAHNPAAVGISFLPNLLITPTFSAGMQQFNTVSIDYSQYGGFRQKAIRPVSMSFEQAEQTGSLGQFGKPE